MVRANVCLPLPLPRLRFAGSPRRYCLPCAAVLRSFRSLTDYASQSRFLIIVPLLMLAAPECAGSTIYQGWEQYLERIRPRDPAGHLLRRAGGGKLKRVGNSTHR